MLNGGFIFILNVWKIT
ncbi:hypothetical protein D043_2078A, partial [Vibrio parahaemolyticus EKP-021]